MSWINVVSGNGLSPGQRPAITLSNLDILSIGPLRTQSIELRINTLSFDKQLAFRNVE